MRATGWAAGFVAAAIVIGGVAPAAPAGAGSAPSTNAVTGWVSALPSASGPTATSPHRDVQYVAISGNGRYVAFETAGQFTALATGSLKLVYVKDLLTEQVVLATPNKDGGVPNGQTELGGISDDGRYLSFSSNASDLVANDANGITKDSFVRDLVSNTTTLVSKSSAGVQVTTDTPANGRVVISGDGKTVVFASRAPQLLSPATNILHLYAHDLDTSFTQRVTQRTDGTVANNNSFNPDVSYDGRYVVWSSLASNLILSDDNGVTRDVFLRDRTAATTSLVSFTSNGGQTDANSDWPSISDDGTKVAFRGEGAMTPGDTASVADIFVRNRTAGTTTKVSTALGGGEADLDAGIPKISGDGTTVTWNSIAGEYISGGSNGQTHVYVRAGTNPIVRASVSSGGTLGNQSSTPWGLSTDGKAMAMISGATNFATGDTANNDAYVRRNPEVGPHGTTALYSAAMVQHFTGAPNATKASAMNARILAGASPEHEVLALASDAAWAAKRGPLARLYTAYFKRLPDTAGFEYWRKKLEGGMYLDQVSAKFAASSEFKTKYGNTTNSQYVTLVYNNVLGRDPDATGLSFWVKKLEGGMSRGTVMTNFSESSEGKRKFRPWVDTVLVSMGLLGAIPPTNLATAVLDYMKLDSSERGIQRLIVSPEYAATV
ncbi:MAG: DUF4214 domain-containing protein [Acidimicrobiales bacterium]